MPVFVEDPALLSKSRLKSDLVAHNVELPAAGSKKEVYLKLHLKHIGRKNTAGFSSKSQNNICSCEQSPEDAVTLDPTSLTDEDLKAALLAHGVKAGPIVASTRTLYEKKLSKLLQSAGHKHLNGAEKGVLYSDSEEEEEEEENGEEDAESGIQTDLFPDAQTTPTGIYATRRRPIKGAAGRPIQYLYPDSPVSPTTLERREVERRLVPVLVQIVVFLVVACVLYLTCIYLLDKSFSPLEQTSTSSFTLYFPLMGV
uniref:Zgc:92287 n=1 Tax=Echeneis naucrates TaxID=173247 RepID=A0A665VNI1_ECHNA